MFESILVLSPIIAVTGAIFSMFFTFIIYKNKKDSIFNQNLYESYTYSRSLIEASIDPLIAISREGIITDVNDATIKIIGLSRDTLIGTKFNSYFTEPDKANEGYQRVLNDGFIHDFPLVLRDVSGTTTEVSFNATIYRNNFGQIQGIFAAARDVEKLNKLQRKINNSNLYHRNLIEASLDPFVTISIDGKITDVNKATITATGVQKEDLIGSNFSSYFTEPKLAQEGYEKVIKDGKVVDYHLELMHKDGTTIHVLYNASTYNDSDGNVAGVFAAARDVTEQMHLKQKLEKMALYDHLTELPNRRLYRERASQMLELAKRNKTKFALLFLDVNNFKHYNDTFGHEFGDAVLIKTAQKLNKIFRKSDIISRWAGDEFVVLCNEQYEHMNIQDYLDKINEEFTQTVQLSSNDTVQQSLTISLSIGVSQYPEDGQILDTLERNADQEMYKYKEMIKKSQIK